MQALNDPDQFCVTRDSLPPTPEEIDNTTLAPYRAMSPAGLHAAWRATSASLIAAAIDVPPRVRIAWYGPAMSVRSFLTARLMETWAHGQDVEDTARAAGVNISRTPQDRLLHICHLGVLTRGWSYANRGMPVPADDVRVELDSPSGQTWTWGPQDAADSIRGPALDFCLVVTQRRNVDDVPALAIEGPIARDWMIYAQAFAGAPTMRPKAPLPGPSPD